MTSHPGTTTDEQPGLGPERRQELLELADFLGMTDEAEGMRGDMRTERILPRLKRALDLVGLPVSTTPDTPGIVVTLMGKASAGWPSGSVAVSWRPGADLTALDDEAEIGDPADRFARAVDQTLDVALAAILRNAGLRVLTDSQFSGVIIADTRPADDLEALGF
ncbi:hypothetical protein [Kitasatospora sp. NPDC004272]